MVIQVVHPIGVVPEDAEIRSRGLQPREAAHGFITVGNALGVGILGHAPDALDGFVLFYQLFHHVHVRPGGRHGYGNHLDAEIFGDGEVAVIAGHRAQELHLRQAAPRRVAHDAVGPGAADGVKHHVQGRVAINDNVLGVVFHHIAQQLAGFQDTGQLAVSAAVGAVVAGQVGIGVQHVHHFHGKVQLLLAGDAAAHVQAHAQGLDFFILRFQLIIFGGQFLHRHFRIGLHKKPSFQTKNLPYPAYYAAPPPAVPPVRMQNRRLKNTYIIANNLAERKNKPDTSSTISGLFDVLF